MYTSMKNMLLDASKNHYAVMAINCFNIETCRCVINAAEKEDAPIIVNIFKDHLLTHCESALIAPVVRYLADRAKISVALNYDHGSDEKSLLKAIDDGFSSVMADMSQYTIEENIKRTRSIADYAHSKGASIEGEIGSLGQTEGGNYTGKKMYTDPDEAKKFFDETDIDALAISFGSSHGNYPEGKSPEFDFDRLKAIKKKTGAPLVLHGGSGSGEENIINAVKYGISKINVGCDFMNANKNNVMHLLEENPDINYFDLIHESEKESEKLVRYYIGLSGSKGKNKNF